MAVTDHLLRDLAPIPARAWTQLDDEARERLTPLLGGRRIADWAGTGGWRRDAMSLGRTTGISGPPGGVPAGEVRVRQRRVLPLAEVRVPFTVAREEIEDIQRGARDPELDDLDRAARVAATVENAAVFHGWAAAGITGITDASPYPAVPLGADAAGYPHAVSRAVDLLRGNGIDGPYTLALEPDHHTRIMEATEHGGQILADHLVRILGGSLMRVPGVQGAVLVSARGGDFVLDVGQDLSIGYDDHDADGVHLYLEESFAFLVTEPDAAVALT